MQKAQYFNRDISWLTFNGRVLDEAGADNVPLIERIRFLSIFSSNLDEFYRVRFPVLKALKNIGEKSNEIDADEQQHILQSACQIVIEQQEQFGRIFTGRLIPQLKDNDIRLVYNEPIPQVLTEQTTCYFLSDVLTYLQPVTIKKGTAFFPENNKLYFIVQLSGGVKKERLILLNIPSDSLPRFYSTQVNDIQYICFLDDIVRENIPRLFKGFNIIGCYSIKITRDAELDLKDEYPGDLSEQIEKQLQKRDLGLATRFLYDANTPLRILELLNHHLNLGHANAVKGGRYHNLKDLYGLPVDNPALLYDKWPALDLPVPAAESLTETIAKGDLLINTPYQSYNIILRFFNEAATNPDVADIIVMLYRVASDSRIVNALISAAKNGKKVKVLVELKARFDEANNLKWAKKMIAAGIEIIYSVASFKVHAKLALVRYRKDSRISYSGLLATGNFNEETAKFYTDHILLTANHKLLREVELLFIFLSKRGKPGKTNQIKFKRLLVAGFNLQDDFIALIDREIGFAKAGKPASIRIKMNNLDERVLINKLYEAAQAGVNVQLIVRSVCCLVPGVKGLSENITIKRIVDRYLEHGRIFIFNNYGKHEVFMGSADWMNRNIYRRIEVCFPIYDEAIKKQVIDLLEFQINDTAKAVTLDKNLNHLKPDTMGVAVASQAAIYQYLKSPK